MELFGVEISHKNKPSLDPEFVPMHLWNKAYLAQAREPFTVAITASDNRCVVHRTRIRNQATSLAADYFYVNRLVKSLLWLHGGYQVSIVGSKTMYDYLKETYSLFGPRKFDVEFMSRVYDQPFSIELLPAPPPEQKDKKFLSRHLNGYRIGFDAGGNARKVAAVANGKVVYTEEVLWQPVTNPDPEYHYQQIMDALLAAAKKIPRIDAIGVSSAGIYVDNQVRAASLFRSVPEADFDEKVRNIYQRAAHAMGCDQLEVVNDGDVAALAGAMSLDANSVLGISMGSSQAAGFVDEKGSLTGWLNELAFIPIDANPHAPTDEWSQDQGCGVEYFSQKALFRLAEVVGIALSPKDSPRQQLRIIQMKAEQGDSKATAIYQTIGTYLGHTLGYYHSVYHFGFVLLLGIVMSGAGGDLIFNAAQKTLAEEYPDVASQIVISLPDENSRRVGQSVAAASLPEC